MFTNKIPYIAYSAWRQRESPKNLNFENVAVVEYPPVNSFFEITMNFLVEYVKADGVTGCSQDVVGVSWIKCNEFSLEYT